MNKPINYTFDWILSWRNWHCFPFLHFPAFQRLQTTDLTGKLWILETPDPFPLLVLSPNRIDMNVCFAL